MATKRFTIDHTLVRKGQRKVPSGCGGRPWSVSHHVTLIYTGKCWHWKPERAHHCRMCGTMVDHMLYKNRKDRLKESIFANNFSFRNF